MPRHVLIIAFHYPPVRGSSGIQRTLRFVQHLPAFGWQPVVLTTQIRAYERTSDDLLADIPRDVTVRRAFAVDTTRHLSIGGRYFGWTARPDRWVSWKFDGVRQGMRLIRELRPAAIWSTYPIATAHLIGAELHRRSGLPWIADFRDPMAQDGYPEDPRVWSSFKRIEENAARNASLCVFTTPGAARHYRERYPQSAPRMVVVENGFDEESFSDADRAVGSVGQRKPGPLVLLHSGIVYPSERDPKHLFAALRQLREDGRLSPLDLRVRFRAAVHDDLLRALAADHDVEDFIELCPTVPYREALAEMQSVDGLLILQASNCNEQIPAKIYEYLRAGRPILGLTDPSGDTAGVLRGTGLKSIARLDSSAEIQAVLMAFIAAIRTCSADLPDPQAVRLASRRGRTEQLAKLIDSVIR